MDRIGFDNEKYLKMQSECIRQRIEQFGGKLYLEFGGKLFDDYHASRVLPGFEPDSKLKMLLELKDQAEVVIVINAADIENNKIRFISIPLAENHQKSRKEGFDQYKKETRMLLPIYKRNKNEK